MAAVSESLASASVNVQDAREAYDNKLPVVASSQVETKAPAYATVEPVGATSRASSGSKRAAKAAPAKVSKNDPAADDARPVVKLAAATQSSAVEVCYGCGQ